MSPRFGASAAWAGLLALCLWPAARADEPTAVAVPLRDPTVPPLAARAPASAPAASMAASSADPSASPAWHLMVLKGKPYVIERGWPRGVGERLGEARIERIEGQTLWLRDGAGLRKISLYPGVQIRPVASAPDRDSVSPKPKRARRPDAAATLATKDPTP